MKLGKIFGNIVNTGQWFNTFGQMLVSVEDAIHNNAIARRGGQETPNVYIVANEDFVLYNFFSGNSVSPKHASYPLTKAYFGEIKPRIIAERAELASYCLKAFKSFEANNFFKEEYEELFNVPDINFEEITTAIETILANNVVKEVNEGELSDSSLKFLKNEDAVISLIAQFGELGELVKEIPKLIKTLSEPELLLEQSLTKNKESKKAKKENLYSTFTTSNISYNEPFGNSVDDMFFKALNAEAYTAAGLMYQSKSRNKASVQYLSPEEAEVTVKEKVTPVVLKKFLTDFQNNDTSKNT